MKVSVLRAALLSSASLVMPAVSAILVLPSQATAQTVCTADGSNNITCADGSTVVATGSATGGALTIQAPPEGLATTSVGFQTVVLNPGPGGNTIRTSSAGTPGIDLTAGGALTLNAPSINVATTGAASNAVELSGGSVTGAIGNIFTNTNNSSGVVIAASGNVDFTIGDVDYGGEFSDGVVITSTAGDINVDIGTVTNHASGASNDGVHLTGGAITATIDEIDISTLGGVGLLVTATDDVDITVGDVTNYDAGIRISAGANDVDLTCGNVTTEAPGASSSSVTINATGAVNLNCGDIGTLTGSTGEFAKSLDINGGAGAITATIGDVVQDSNVANAVEVTGTGAITLTTGNVTSDNFGSSAILIGGGAGAIDLTCGNILTTSQDNSGVSISGTGTIDVTCGNLNSTWATSTTSAMLDISGGAGAITAAVGNVGTIGDGALGIEINGTGSINLTTGTVTTQGEDADAVVLTGGAVTGTLGDIFTNADNSTGVLVTATGNVDLDIGNVNYGGEFSDGVVINAGSNAINVDIGTVTNHLSGSTNDGVVLTGGLISATIEEIDISTLGGIALLVTATDDVDITVGDVTNFDTGIRISAGANDVDLTCGNVTTRAPGINSSSVTINATGTIDLMCGDISTLTGASGEFARSLDINGGAGAITATIGDVVQDSNVANAVEVSGTGPITLTTGNVTSDNFGGSAIRITGGAGAIDLTCGNITTSSQDNSGVTISGTGTIDVMCGNLSSTWPAAVPSNSIMLDITGGGGAITAEVGNVSTLAEDAIGVRITGTGPIDLTTGLISTTGDEATGVLITGGAGPISAQIAGASTTGENATAVQITGSGPLTFTNSGTISATGTGSGAIDISGVTTAAVSCGNASSTATGVNAVDISANGNTTVTCGTVSTGPGSTAINVANTAGTTTVTGGTTTATGAGSEGIRVTSSGGAVTVNSGTVTSTQGGVVAISTASAPVTVNATGNVTSTAFNGIFVQTGGTGTVSINAGVTVTGANTGVFLASGTNVLTVNGTLRSSTTGNAPYIVIGGPLTLNLNAGGSILGTLAFTPGNDVFNNAANYTQSGVIDFGLGNDAFNNSGTFTQTAAVNFGDGNDTLANTGTYNAVGTTDFGAGTDVANNSGTLRVTGGAATFAGLETFNNSGTVTMVDGAANDTLTLSGNYVGSGSGSLALDVVGTPTGNTADLLVVGGNISGTTVVNPNFVNPAIDPDGVLIVDGGGTLAANAFTLGNTTSQGLINYSLLTQGNNVFLATAANAAVFDIGVLGSLNQDMWYQSAEAYLACAASRRNEFGVARTSPIGICGQLYWSRDRYGDRDLTANLFGDSLIYSDRVTTHRRGAQVDLGFRAGGNLHVGLTAGYGHAEARQETGTNLDLEGHNIGAYAQYGSELGFYAGLMVKRDRYDARIVNPGVIERMEVDAKSTGIDGELGWRTRGLGALVDLGGGLSYVKSKLDDFSAGNIAFDNDSATSLRGRLSARLGWSGDWAPFVGLSLFHEFEDGDDIGVMSGTVADSFERRPRGTWARVEGGLGGGSHGGPLVTLWGDFGDVKGGGLRAGFRF